MERILSFKFGVGKCENKISSEQVTSLLLAVGRAAPRTAVLYRLADNATISRQLVVTEY